MFVFDRVSIAGECYGFVTVWSFFYPFFAVSGIARETREKSRIPMSREIYRERKANRVNTEKNLRQDHARRDALSGLRVGYLRSFAVVFGRPVDDAERDGGVLSNAWSPTSLPLRPGLSVRAR